MKIEIEPCICKTVYADRMDPNWDGIPVLQPNADMSQWRIRCTRCELHYYKPESSPYLAIKEWNRVQRKVKAIIEKGVFEE